MSDPHVCARCAARGHCCCRLQLGQEAFCFPLSRAEKDRIREALPDNGGFVPEPNSEAFLAQLVALFPDEKDLVLSLFPLGKEHLRLATDPLGHCRFLGPNGCRIPTEARPYYCRLFPHWVDHAGRIVVFDSPNCLALREQSGAPLYPLLKTSAATVRDLHARLRLAWGLPPRKGMAPPKKGF